MTLVSMTLPRCWAHAWRGGALGGAGLGGVGLVGLSAAQRMGAGTLGIEKLALLPRLPFGPAGGGAFLRLEGLKIGSADVPVAPAELLSCQLAGLNQLPQPLCGQVDLSGSIRKQHQIFLRHAHMILGALQECNTLDLAVRQMNWYTLCSRQVNCRARSAG
jgi:hypothetical protein